MKVSVVVPAYNEEKFIKNCLESLLNQEEPADEIIVVDNNSTDATRSIAKQYPVRIISEKNQGRTYARNKGFNAAKYEIIARTDADTIVPPNWIKKIKKGFKAKKTIAISGPENFYARSKVVEVTKWPSQIFSTTIRQVLGHECLYGFNTAVRKSVWELVAHEVCLDDRDVHEDIDLAIHVAPYGNIVFDRSLLVSTSPRRWKKITPYFEYPYRSVKMIREHKIDVIENTRLRIAKRVSPRFLLDQIKPPQKFT